MLPHIAPFGLPAAGCLGAPTALLGSTTEIYLHVALGVNGLGVASPLDTLEVAGGRLAFVA